MVLGVRFAVLGAIMDQDYSFAIGVVVVAVVFLLIL
jgi:hypothetical protein